jgi:hypothetical protein
VKIVDGGGWGAIETLSTQNGSIFKYRVGEIPSIATYVVLCTPIELVRRERGRCESFPDPKQQRYEIMNGLCTPAIHRTIYLPIAILHDSYLHRFNLAFRHTGGVLRSSKLSTR